MTWPLTLVQVERWTRGQATGKPLLSTKLRTGKPYGFTSMQQISSFQRIVLQHPPGSEHRFVDAKISSCLPSQLYNRTLVTFAPNVIKDVPWGTPINAGLTDTRPDSQIVWNGVPVEEQLCLRAYLRNSPDA